MRSGLRIIHTSTSYAELDELDEDSASALAAIEAFASASSRMYSTLLHLVSSRGRGEGRETIKEPTHRIMTSPSGTGALSSTHSTASNSCRGT